MRIVKVGHNTYRRMRWWKEYEFELLCGLTSIIGMSLIITSILIVQGVIN